MKDNWLSALRHMTYGIYVLTTQFDKTINGMIASWVTQVSYDPPLILVAIHPNRYSHELLKKSGCFALHALERSQKEMLNRFKGPDPAKKFSGINWEPGQTGAPVIKDCMAWLECRVKESWTPGNHTLFIGEIVHADSGQSGQPLCTLDYEGMYTGKI